MKFQNKDFFPPDLCSFLALTKFIYGPSGHVTPALVS